MVTCDISRLHGVGIEIRHSTCWTIINSHVLFLFLFLFLFCFVLFCFVLFCFVCFVLFCFLWFAKTLVLMLNLTIPMLWEVHTKLVLISTRTSVSLIPLSHQSVFNLTQRSIKLTPPRDNLMWTSHNTGVLNPTPEFLQWV